MDVSANVSATDRTSQSQASAVARVGYAVGNIGSSSVIENCYHEESLKFEVVCSSVAVLPSSDNSCGVGRSEFTAPGFFRNTLGFNGEYWNYPEDQQHYDYPSLK